MTNKEKLALEKAFDIPAPQNKQRFAGRYRELEKLQEHRSRFPVFMKIASAAAMCAVILGVWVNVKDNAKPMPKEDEINVVTVTDTTAVSEEDKADEINEHTVTETASTALKTTTSAKKNGAAVTSNTTSKTTAENIAVTETKTDNSNDSKSEDTTAAKTTSRTTEKSEHKTTTSTAKNTQQTATSTTSKKTTRTTATTTAKKPPITTTTVKNGDDTVQTTTVETNQPKGTNEPPPKTDEPNTPDRPNDAVEQPIGRDLTVDTGVRYYPGGNVIDPSDLMNNNSAGSNGEPLNTDALIRNSDNLFVGDVEEVIYTSYDGDPYVQLNVKVTECLKGSLNYGDKVSVFYRGGYMPARDYVRMYGLDADVPDDALVDMNIESITPQNGEKYLFLTVNGGQRLPDNALMLTESVYYSVYPCDGFNCRNDSSSKSFTLNDVIEKLH